MPPSGRPEARAFGFGLAGIAAVTLWRVALLPFDAADLFVDDAQYWFWGRDLAWGYYSKPPLIAWLVRLSTELGSDAPFWLRLPMPLIHAGTAVLVSLIARRAFDARVGALAGVAFVSLPGVAVGSLLISTDTPMLFFFALAMLVHLHLAGRRSVGWAAVLGVAVGLGLLSKYAMVYFPLGAGLAAAVLPRARIAWRDAGVAAAVAATVVAPNLAWNAAHEFTTLQHTADNADWQGPRLNASELAAFLAGQFAVAGPVLFAAYLAGLARLGREPRLGYFAAVSLPVFAIVSVQALVSGANANWAAAGHPGAVVVAIVVLREHPRWLAASFAVNLAATLALPVAVVFADNLRTPSGELLLARYVGRAEVSLRAAGIARTQGLDTLVASDRAFLADFFYTLRDTGLTIRAEPVAGFPPHHYAQTQALPPGPGEVLYLTRDAAGPQCRDGAPALERVARWRPAEGYVTGDIYAFRVSRACWHGGTM